MTLACLDVPSKKKWYRDISHIILKHTQLVTSWYQKYLHRRKGEKVMTATICVRISVVNGVVSQLVAKGNQVDMDTEI